MRKIIDLVSGLSIRMGYERELLESLLAVLKTAIGDLSGVPMLEFGNQEVYDHYDKVEKLYAEYGYTHRMERRIVKPFFEHLGLRPTQIDYNGRDGALALDVRKDIASCLPQTYKVITNIGFSEHVGEGEAESTLLRNQYGMFKNLHDVGAVGAVYFHSVPLTRNWYRHGVCDYSLDFFSLLCAANEYSIIKGPYIEAYHRELQSAVAYRKVKDAPFISFEQFCTIPGIRSTASD